MDKIDFKERDKKYNLWARKQPAYISLVIPFILILLFYQEHEQQFSDAKYIFTLIISIGGIMPSLFFLYMFLLRDIAKVFPESILKLYHYPTTYFLCDESNTFTSTCKDNIKQKIKSELNIDLYKMNNHSIKNKDYTQRINEAIDLIRERTRTNHILFEFNCIYGFYRNLAAGLFIDFIILIVAKYTIIFYVEDYEKIVNGMLVCTIIVFLSSMILSFVNGKRYAKQLYNVFLFK